MKRINKIFLFSILFFITLSCSSKNIEGIVIGDTLYNHQSITENLKMKSLISKALEKDKEAIIQLKDFPNGGGESSYDLGYIITQLIYKIGEKDFCLLIKDLSKAEQKEFEGLIMVGLEYGDNDYDGKMDNKTIKTEFPLLNTIFNK